MITESLYQTYLKALLEGNKARCFEIVKTLLENNISIKTLYIELFQRSLYKVGELWEYNQISVAREHLATSITDNLLSSTYPYLFSGEPCAKSAIISCTANEYHQLGGKMVADIFELNGWDAHFLGANTPPSEILRLIEEIKPDVIGLTLSVYFNLPAMKKAVEIIRTNYHQLDIFVGGHAFLYGGTQIVKNHSGTEYIQSLSHLEENL